VTKQIELTKGNVALVDDEDYQRLSRWSWWVVPSGSRHKLYAQRWDNTVKPRRAVWMHRVVCNAPPGTQVDHINMNGLDNRRENLRVCTQGQNQANRGPQQNNKSGYKGVCPISRRGYWQASIRHNRKSIYLGEFSSKKDAAQTYNKAALELFGEFAYLNEVTHD